MANHSHFDTQGSQLEQESHGGTELLPIAQNKDLTETVGNTRMRMGFLDKFKFDRENSAVMREKLKEIASAMMERQKSEIVHGLMLDLDLAKKNAFVRYVEQVGAVDEQLLRASNAMEMALREMLSDEIFKSFELKDRWKKNLERLKSSGLANAAEYQEEVERMEKWIDTMKGNIEGKVELVIRSHIKSLQVTLELLRDKVVTGESSL